MAGMIYARELQQGLFSTASMRDKFRAVSRQWHRLLEFQDSEEGGVMAGIRRKRAPYDTEREYNQMQRFRRLQQVDIASQLWQIMGPSAAFRGQQEAVIRAIIRGESPIVQVAGTGEGKRFCEVAKLATNRVKKFRSRTYVCMYVCMYIFRPGAVRPVKSPIGAQDVLS
jgi:hypothetical protein